MQRSESQHPTSPALSTYPAPSSCPLDSDQSEARSAVVQGTRLAWRGTAQPLTAPNSWRNGDQPPGGASPLRASSGLRGGSCKGVMQASTTRLVLSRARHVVSLAWRMNVRTVMPSHWPGDGLQSVAGEAFTRLASYYDVVGGGDHC